MTFIYHLCIYKCHHVLINTNVIYAFVYTSSQLTSHMLNITQLQYFTKKGALQTLRT